MEVHVVASTADSYKVQFSDPASRFDVTVGIATALMAQWGLPTDQLMPTMTVLIDEILMSHNPDKPLLKEYDFTMQNSAPTLDGTIDLIRQNKI